MGLAPVTLDLSPAARFWGTGQFHVTSFLELEGEGGALGGERKSDNEYAGPGDVPVGAQEGERIFFEDGGDFLGVVTFEADDSCSRSTAAKSIAGAGGGAFSDNDNVTVGSDGEEGLDDKDET